MKLMRLQQKDFKMYEINEIWGIGKFRKGKKHRIISFLRISSFLNI